MAHVIQPENTAIALMDNAQTAPSSRDGKKREEKKLDETNSEIQKVLTDPPLSLAPEANYKDKGEKSSSRLTSVRMASSLSLGANILLLLAKAIVFALSLSLSVLASLIDSALDLFTQMVLFWTERQVARTSPKYPVVKTRLEPISIMGVSMLMIMSSVIVIRESISALLSAHYDIVFDNYMVITLAACIGIKFLLWLYCRQFKYSPIAQALAEDHMNDVCSNAAAVIAVSVASNVKSTGWLDPVGGICISFYIIARWYQIGRKEMKKLIGRGADEANIQEIRMLCESHSEDMNVDVMRAYHIGRNLLVELEVVMDKHKTLEYVHDVTLELQKKVEQFPYVERAFVHVDYMKRDYDEHKVPTLA
ncbi:CDF transporter, membrane protein [Reticulomyxa filosa]|uniref:CDF transporter, membrane protein n=1 Tax=Reticulomyxa filosa TaxID=46433 RepID=X6NQA3_RETFI|nr:CDF transporter, membrane protein [Reticulomyxa filosa]|eukprot:ETO27864.1 CDF transporter, membrane protein [Reticulomyxa filosa]